jgi:hypothetical protein
MGYFYKGSSYVLILIKVFWATFFTKPGHPGRNVKFTQGVFLLLISYNKNKKKLCIHKHVYRCSTLNLCKHSHDILIATHTKDPFIAFVYHNRTLTENRIRNFSASACSISFIFDT